MLALVDHRSDDPDEESADDITYLLDRAGSYRRLLHTFNEQRREHQRIRMATNRKLPGFKSVI